MICTKCARPTTTYQRCAVCRATDRANDRSRRVVWRSMVLTCRKCGRHSTTRHCRRCRDTNQRAQRKRKRAVMIWRWKQPMQRGDRVIPGASASECAVLVQFTDRPCYYCGKTPCGGVDRLDSCNGYRVGNCVPCCWPCNRLKQDSAPLDFFAYAIVHAATNDQCYRILANIPEGGPFV